MEIEIVLAFLAISSLLLSYLGMNDIALAIALSGLCICIAWLALSISN